jgi:hypothetical protein
VERIFRDLLLFHATHAFRMAAEYRVTWTDQAGAEKGSSGFADFEQRQQFEWCQRKLS